MSGRLAVALILAGVGLIAVIAVLLAIFTDDPALPPGEGTPTPTPRAAQHRPLSAPIMVSAGRPAGQS